MSDPSTSWFVPADRRTLIPAATVIVLRHGMPGSGAPSEAVPDILMVQRSPTMRFAGGAAVFPGGKVDPADRVLAAELAPDEDLDITAARIAAIRETLEETGLAIAVREAVTPSQVAAARAMLIAQGELAPVLAAFGWTLDLARLTLFAHWCPPIERAFDTRFFITDLGTGAVDVAVDATENTRLFWTSAAQALAQADTGALSLLFPTRMNLERLAQYTSFDDARYCAARHRVDRIVPEQFERDGVVWLQIPDGLGYPVLSMPLTKVRRD